eukprot:scaffold36454_cov68-Phaeocystis_antarctica.AAC.10
MAQLALSGGGGVERDRPARDERVGHTWSVTSVDGGGVRRAGVCARDARDTGAACSVTCKADRVLIGLCRFVVPAVAREPASHVHVQTRQPLNGVPSVPGGAEVRPAELTAAGVCAAARPCSSRCPPGLS